MITSREYIREQAGKEEFDIGCKLYRLDRVKQFSYKKIGILDYISGEIKESEQKIYKNSITVSQESGKIGSAVCECTKIMSEKILCRHCVAVLLEYRDEKNRSLSIKEYLERINSGMKVSDRSNVSGINVKQTTPGFKEILDKNAMKKTLFLDEAGIHGKVKIEPQFRFENRNAYVRFKVGTKQMYIVKDVIEFVSHFEYADKVSYGKQLEFVHVKDALDQKSKKIFEFIYDWVVSNREKYRVMYSSRDAVLGQIENGRKMYLKIKEIDLKASDIDKIMNMYKGETIIADIPKKYLTEKRKKHNIWNIVDEPFRYKVEFEGDEANGLEVRFDDVFTCFGNKALYTFCDTKIHITDKKKFDGAEEILTYILKSMSKEVYVASEELTSFVDEIFPEITKMCDCEMVNFTPGDYAIPQPDFEFYIDMPQHNLLSIKPIAVYDGKKYEIYDTETDTSSRNIKEEVKIGKKIIEAADAFETETNSIVILDEDNLLTFLMEGVRELGYFGEVFVSDDVRSIDAVSSPKIDVGVSVAGNMLELNIDMDGITAKDMAEILSKYRKKKKYHRLKNGTIVKLGGEIEMLSGLYSMMNLDERKFQSGTIMLPKYTAMYLENGFEGENEFNIYKDKDFKKLVRNMTYVSENKFMVPDELKDVLREYQRYGFLWIKTLEKNGFGGILADDMGLGKTLQVITFLLSSKCEAPKGESRLSLVVCPASLTYNWKREIEKFAPALNAVIICGSVKEREEIIKQRKDVDIFITSYDMIRRDILLYREISFFCQIIDEAQYIKNHATKVSKAVKKIDAKFKLALTGTPVENRLSELHSIFEYLMPGFLHSYSRFKEEIEIPVVQENDENVMKRLQKLTAPFVLRRLKKDVLDELPDKIEECIYVQMDEEQQRLYDAHAGRLKMRLKGTSDAEFRTGKIEILAELTKLRQICCNPSLIYENYNGGVAKLDACMDMISDAVENGHKILLFSQFTSMFGYIQSELEKRNIEYYTLTGLTKNERRMELVDMFNSGDVPVFCISLRAGGTGLNLTSADIVIHFDPWWNVAVENQATDRAHRIGQKNVVNVFKLIAKGTIEENIIKLQSKKKELADSVLSGDGTIAQKLDREELLRLL